MIKIYLLLVILFAGSITNSNAQIAVSGGTGLAATYTSFTNAAGLFADLNSIAQTGNNIVVSITGNVITEAGTNSLNAGAWTTITITPSGARTISGNVAAPLINFNGADNVTINGLNAGGNTLTIANTNNSATIGTSTVRFIGGATNNTVTNCNLQGSMTMSLASNGGIVYFATDALTTNGNDNNTISNCNIGPAGANLPSRCIYGNGSTTTSAIRNSGIIISNNNIFDFFGTGLLSTSGIYVISGNDNWTISNNRIYQTASRTFTTTQLRYAGITLNSTSGTLGSFTVTGNTIGFATSTGTGITTISGSSNEFRGVDAPSVNTTVASSIQGNTISGISQASSRGSVTFSNSNFIGIMMGTTGGLFNCGNITGNTIGSLDASSTIAITETSTLNPSAPVIGIYDFSKNGNTISNNNIGSITINPGGTPGTAVGFRGILVNTATGVTATINNNTIGGTATGSITDNIIGVNSANGYLIRGIETNLPDVSATGNIIRNMTSSSSGGGTVAVIGIFVYNSTGANLISQNTVHSLTNTPIFSAGVILAGIVLSFPATSNVVERNFVHSLNNTTTNTGCTLAGIIALNSPGTATYSNNMVRLGIKADGSLITTGFNIYGIQDIGLNTNNYYHNSVYIGGSGVTNLFGGKTYAFYSSVANNTRYFHNNIFWNARSNVSSGGSAHIAMSAGGTTQYPTGLTSNYNVLYATGTDGVIGEFNGSLYTTLPNWRTATGHDMISISADPQFVNPTGSAATVDLHLKPSPTLTVCEGNGLTGLPVTLDFDGQLRSSLTAVDIGADAANFTGTDLIGPEMSYTALSNSSCTTPGPSLTAVITDISGVNITSGTRPRLYYKKTTNANTFVGNTNATDGWKWVEATGAGGSPFSFTINYSLVFGGVVTGNTIQYFLTSQDLVATPNVSINSGIYAPAFMPASVALTATAFPVHDPVNTYTVSASGIASSVTIGAAGTYPSLTGAGGLFAAINAAGIDANTTATIIDAAVIETGANALNQMANGCGGPFTLTIKPAASGTTLTGSVASAALLSIKSNYVVIDGSSNGSASKDLTITNTSAVSPNVLLIGSTSAVPVNNVTVKNNIIINGINTSSALVVSDGTTVGNAGYFTNINLQNNDIRNAYIGIYAKAIVSTGNGNALTISGNSLNTSGVNAISHTGIYLQGVDGATVSGNDIGNFETISDEIDNGIWLATGTSNSVVEKNNIHDIKYTGINGYGGKGITISTGLNAANISVRNNMLYGITGDGDSYTSFGAYFNPVAIYAFGTGQGGINIYYNSVYLSGSTLNFSSDVYSLGIALDNNTAATIKDNIVLNELGILALGVGAVGVVAQTSSTQFTSLDYNDYYSNASTGTNLIGKISTTDYASIAAWRTATGQEARSLNLRPNFTSATDLHLISTTNCALDGYGTPIAGITTDYDSQTRDVTTPDMGADEFTSSYSGTLAGIAGTAICENKDVSVSGTTYASSSCGLIAKVLPSGGSAVSGKINVCVTLDASQQYFNAEPYVKRHFDIEPTTSTPATTATITLYFDDAEFVNFNSLNPSWPKMPTQAGGGSTDPNRANLKITQYHGTATTNPSTPGNYSAAAGTGILIDPIDNNIVWNGIYWAVTFNITGFSGFYAHSNPLNPLPVSFNYLNGTKQGSKHLLEWLVTCNSTPRVTLSLERSADARTFNNIYSVTADAVRCAQPFDYTDAQPLTGINYYRLKITDADGKITYSNVIALLNGAKGFELISIAPNPVTGSSFKLNATAAVQTKMEVQVSDVTGRIVKRQTITMAAGYSSIDMNVGELARGTYNIHAITAGDNSRLLRFVKQ